MWIVCITSVRHVLTVNGYGGRQTKENEKSWCFKGWETLVSNIETLQRSAENIALYKGASAVAEQEYRNRRTSIHDVAKTKEQEFAANQDFALLRSTINDQLLTLEIISHTPILTIQGEKDVQETTIQEQEENKRQSKKKDKKE